MCNSNNSNSNNSEKKNSKRFHLLSAHYIPGMFKTHHNLILKRNHFIHLFLTFFLLEINVA